MHRHRGRDEEVKDGCRDDGSPENPSGRQFGSNDTARDLRHEVAPKEGAVNNTGDFMIPFYVMALQGRRREGR